MRAATQRAGAPSSSNVPALASSATAAHFPNRSSRATWRPDLAGSGSRWSEGQLRLRLVDASRLNAATIMPSYYRVDGLDRVGTPWRGKPILSAEQIEDIVAYLVSLRE